MIATSAYAIDFSSPSHMLAQSSTQHLVTIIDGDLQPCPNTCAPGQFIWRDPETDNDCTCRYEMQNCDNSFFAWDVINGTCMCVEQECVANHYFDFNDCRCECDQNHSCESPLTVYGEPHTMVWDQMHCECVCEPEECLDTAYTWNIEACEC